MFKTGTQVVFHYQTVDAEGRVLVLPLCAVVDDIIDREREIYQLGILSPELDPDGSMRHMHYYKIEAAAPFVTASDNYVSEKVLAYHEMQPGYIEIDLGTQVAHKAYKDFPGASTFPDTWNPGDRTHG